MIASARISTPVVTWGASVPPLVTPRHVSPEGVAGAITSAWTDACTGDLAGVTIAALRAVAIALVAAWVAPAAARFAGTRKLRWGLVLLPLLVPSVVLGYAYVGPLTAAGRAGAEAGYILLMACRLLPLAVVMQVLLPAPPVPAAAMHAAELAGVRSFGMRLRGPQRNALLVFGLTAVLAFQEFELVSLFYLPSWTVTVFDAQVGGARLADTLGMTLIPVGLGVVSLGLLAGFYRWSGGRGTHETVLHPSRRGDGWGPILAAAVTLGWPCAHLFPSLPELAEQVPFLREIGHSCIFGAGATLGAGALALTAPPAILLPLALPGLCGSLVLGLGLLSGFQVAWLQWAYDTPLPLLGGSILLLMPLALVLRIAVDRSAASPGRHAATLLGHARDPGRQRSARALWLALRGNRLALGGTLLFAFSFFEVVLGDLLAPTNMTPAAPRLYNLLHYGRSPGLAAMVLVMMMAAVFVAASGWMIWRGFARWYQRAPRPS